MGELSGRGKTARFIADVDSIVEHLARALESGDVVTVMSNGAFGDLHEKLLAVLRAPSHSWGPDG